MLTDEGDLQQQLQQFQVYIESSKFNSSYDQNRGLAYSVVPLKDFAFEKYHTQVSQHESISYLTSLRNNNLHPGAIRKSHQLQYMKNLRLLLDKNKRVNYKEEVKNSKIQDNKQKKPIITVRANPLTNENKVNTISLISLAQTDNYHNDSISSIQDFSMPSKFYHQPKQKSLSNLNTTCKPMEKTPKLLMNTTFYKKMKNQLLLLNNQNKEKNNLQEGQSRNFLDLSLIQSTQRSQTQKISLQGQNYSLSKQIITNSKNNERANVYRTQTQSNAKLLNQDISNYYQPIQQHQQTPIINALQRIKTKKLFQQKYHQKTNHNPPAPQQPKNYQYDLNLKDVTMNLSASGLNYSFNSSIQNDLQMIAKRNLGQSRFSQLKLKKFGIKTNPVASINGAQIVDRFNQRNKALQSFLKNREYL